MAADTGLRLVHSAPTEDPDALLRQVARGDREAYEALFDLLAPSVLGIARRVVRDPSIAEDVTQETFLEVWRNATRFDADRGKAKTWVLTLAHRRAVDAVRRSESQRRNDGHAGFDDIDHDAPEQAAIKAEEHAEVRGCLDTLTELQLESVRLAYFQGYTYPEVAALLDKPLPTIKTRMRDGLIRLRDCMEGRVR